MVQIIHRIPRARLTAAGLAWLLLTACPRGQSLAERYPPAAELLARSAIAIDAEYATPDQPIPSQAEVACIPPVSGG